MDRVYASGAAGTPPAAPASPSVGYPQAANPGLGQPATKPGPHWYHMITEELRNVVAEAGLTPDHADLTQLKQALLAMFLRASGFTMTGDITMPPGGSVKFAASSNAWSGDNNNLYAFIGGILKATISATGLTVSGLSVQNNTNATVLSSAGNNLIGTSALVGWSWASDTAYGELASYSSGFTSSAYFQANGATLRHAGGNINIAAASAGTDINFWNGSTLNAILYSTGVFVVNGAISSNATLKSGGYTVATLPAGANGTWAYVTDALNPSWNTTLTGGGAVICPVFLNADGWHAAISPASLGVGQTWQNVAASRAVGTTYQNTTGKPIELSINISSSTGSKLEVSEDSVAWVVVGSFANTAAANITFNQTAIVPNGHYYRATQTGTIGTWSELR